MKYKNRISIISEKLLYRGWSTLKQYTIRYKRSNQIIENQIREVYESGNGVAVLLINKKTEKILLIKQFRLPVYLNDHPDGFIIECCAGILENMNPELNAIKEVAEETGYQIEKLHKIYEAFSAPGAHKEKIYYYYGYYEENMKTGKGGGLDKEQEDIETLEISFSEIKMLLESGKIIDSKTIVLLQWALLNKSKL